MNRTTNKSRNLSTKSYLRPTVPIRVEERNLRPIIDLNLEICLKNTGSRVSKVNHKKYPSKKHSETQARAPFDEEDDDEDEDFSAKPKTTSFSKSKSSSKPFRKKINTISRPLDMANL
ncbi:hypothetical protein CEXT_496321 [Caerostris extrusa]|uniref:Uncharacterized protein n=1 Tax=Caerostris extrusa TaxID=172846 RepID=A0AAV4VIF7_CAEEX|nr:hypothetical protein CEXT_496321 [Caerostris extrusa]